jgi:hypothetical protein
MKKLINNPRTYILLLYILFVVVGFYIKGNVAQPALVAIVFYFIGNVGKQGRENLLKSIPGGGIVRPPKKPVTKPKDD